MEKDHPFLIHAKLGAVLAKEKYGVTDFQILSAIRYHTTGYPNMTLLESIIFSADFIEPNRKMLDCLPAIRTEIYRDLPKAVFMILQQTLVHLKHRDQPVDENSLKAIEFYKKFA
jgi:predicted HD superfamily hydrolase involved in NAD metabolism